MLVLTMDGKKKQKRLTKPLTERKKTMNKQKKAHNIGYVKYTKNSLLRVGDIVFYGNLPRPSKCEVHDIKPNGLVQVGWRTWPVDYVVSRVDLYRRVG